MLRTIVVASLLVCSSAVPGWTGPKPSDYPNHRPLCTANPADTVADFSMSVDALRLNGERVYAKLKSFGIKTIVRYYDHDNETIPCKTLLNDEAKAIIDNGFQLAVVFQHNNGSPHTFFSESRGTDDAKRALSLAKHNGQPPKTTIYFGVDGADQRIKDLVYMYNEARGGAITKELAKEHDWDEKDIKRYNEFLKWGPKKFPSKKLGKVQPEDMLPYVDRYFAQVAAEFKASANAGGPSYKIGVYGSGLVCDRLMNGPNPVVSHCWLAQSVGWPNYDVYRKNGEWTLLQKNPTYCPTWINLRDKRTVRPKRKEDQAGFDFNLVKPADADFGQWKSKLPGTTDFKRPKSCPQQ